MLANRPALDIAMSAANYEIVSEELSIPRMLRQSSRESESVQIEIKTSVLMRLLSKHMLHGEDMIGINQQDKQTLRTLYLKCINPG